MRMTNGFLACLGLVAALGAAPEAAAQGQPPPPAPALALSAEAPPEKAAPAKELLPLGSGGDPRVQAIFDQAVQAFDSGRLDDAWRLLNQAWTMNRGESYDIAANLGIVAMKLGNHVDAAHYLTTALKKFPVTGETAVRDNLQERLAESRARVSVVIVRVQPDTAELTLNGKPETRERLASGELFVLPGELNLAVKAPGHIAQRVTLRVPAGKRAETSISLKREPPLWPVFVAGGVGVGSALVGAGLMIAGAGERSDAEDLYNQIDSPPGSGGCAEGAADPRCPDLNDTARRADTLHDVGLGFLIGGGVAMAGAGGYYLWRELVRRGDTTPPPVVVAPAVGMGGAAISLSGTF